MEFFSWNLHSEMGQGVDFIWRAPDAIWRGSKGAICIAVGQSQQNPPLTFTLELALKSCEK